MVEIHTPKVLNVHHFGSIENLPANTIYIGRPGPHGNAYSSKSGVYTKEECVALHRVDLYQSLSQDPSLFSRLKAELSGRDLACWCKQPKRIAACHGDNFLHIFSPATSRRDYTRSISFYLTEDLKAALQRLSDMIRLRFPLDRYLMMFIRLGDLRVDLQDALRLCRKSGASGLPLWFFLSAVAVDLELAAADSDPDMIDYRVQHAMWRINWYLGGWDNRDKEPSSPHIKPKRSSPS